MNDKSFNQEVLSFRTIQNGANRLRRPAKTSAFIERMVISLKKVLAAVVTVTLFALLLVPVNAKDEQKFFDRGNVFNAVQSEVIEALLETINTKYGVSMYVVTRPSDDKDEDLTFVQYTQKFLAENEIDEKRSDGLVAVLGADRQSSIFYPYGKNNIFTNEFIFEVYHNADMYYVGEDLYTMYQEIVSQVDGYLLKKVGLQEQPKIVDNAGLLSAEQEDALLTKIDNIIKTYSFDVVIITTNGIGGKTIVEYSDDAFDYGGYGIGANRDGLAFVINMDGHDYYTSTRGYGITAFTDYGIEKMCEDVVPLLTGGDYYTAFDLYLDNVSQYLEQAKTGKPYDVGNRIKSTADYVKSEAVLVIVSLIIAIIVALGFRSTMNNARIKTSAGNYIKKGGVNLKNGADNGVNLTGQADVYMYSTTSKTPRQTSSSSGGSSTHTGSSGASHGGGGGKF